MITFTNCLIAAGIIAGGLLIAGIIVFAVKILVVAAIFVIEWLKDKYSDKKRIKPASENKKPSVDKLPNTSGPSEMNKGGYSITEAQRLASAATARIVKESLDETGRLVIEYAEFVERILNPIKKEAATKDKLK